MTAVYHSEILQNLVYVEMIFKIQIMLCKKNFQICKFFLSVQVEAKMETMERILIQMSQKLDTLLTKWSMHSFSNISMII